MLLGQKSEVFTPGEDWSWLGSAHATDTWESITLDGDAFVSIFTDGVVPSGVVLAKRTSDGLYIPYADSTTASGTITRTATGGTFNVLINGQASDDIDASAAVTAAVIQAAIRAIDPDFAGVTVTGSAGGPFTVTATGLDDAVDIVVDDSAATGGTVTYAVVNAGGVESPAGESVAAGHLATTKNLGGTTTATVGPTPAALMWHGQVIEANLPTNHGLTAAAKRDLTHIHYV